MLRNTPVAALRRFTVLVYTTAGDPAPASTLFNGANEKLVDQGDGNYIAATGTLTNATRALGLANDIVESVDHANDKLQLTAHGLETGAGPVQFTTTGALPAGLSLATNYWVIKFDANNIQLAASLNDALDGPTFVNMTNPGTGTHTLVLTNAKQPINGVWVYEATQAEIANRANYFALRISKSGFKDAVHVEPVEDGLQLHAGAAAAATSTTLTLDASASSTNDFYKDALVVIVGGTGAGQVNTISSYAGGTKIATLARAWGTTPAALSQFVIVPGPAAASSAGVAASVWAAVGEGAHTYGDLVRGMVSAIAGKTEGYNTGSIVAKSLSGAKTRWTWTVDETGRLTVTPGDLT